MMLLISALAALGFCISLYAYFLERKIKQDPTFKPACDINDRISCTKPLMSEYSNILYFSNALLGMAYYALIIILASFQMHTFLLITTIIGCIVSGILAYILYFKIKSLCLVCTSLYSINIILLLLVVFS